MHTDSHELLVRDASPPDLPAIQAIYAHYVRHALATFELIPPDLDEMRRRWQAVCAHGLPWLVAERAGKVIGYCYATPYRPRPGYRHTVEESIYLAAGQGGGGVGSRLLQALLAHCEQGPWRQAVAVIARPHGAGNDASEALHRRFGFEQAGLLRDVGFKQGQWIDTLLMQRALGPGAATLPGSEHDQVAQALA